MSSQQGLVHCHAASLGPAQQLVGHDDGAGSALGAQDIGCTHNDGHPQPLSRTFLKHHAPRLAALLRGNSYEGGGVPLGLGYALTALNDVGEEKGWHSRARIDEMSLWEQKFFHHLTRKWSHEDPSVTKEELRHRRALGKRH